MTIPELRCVHFVAVYTNIQVLSVKPTLNFHFDQQNCLPCCRILFLLKLLPLHEEYDLLGYNTYSPSKVKLIFGGSCGLLLQIRRISHVRYYRLSHWFLARHSFESEDGNDIFLRNVGWLSTKYMASYPKEIELFITTTVKTLNPT
jgi:hypothetical protein